MPRREREVIEERAFHRWLVRSARSEEERRALRDDVAPLPPAAHGYVITTDAFVERVHFDPVAGPHHVGEALVEANLSDLAAKGARPVGFFLDLLLPPGTSAAWARGAVRGVRRALARHGARLLGGDTKPAPSRTLVGTAVGEKGPIPPPSREGSKVGDLVVVTGTVGRGGGAWFGPRGSRGPRGRPDPLGFRARVREGRTLARWAHAMMDTSDGIFDSAHLLAEAGAVAVTIDEARLPLHRSLLRRSMPAPARRAAAGFGGDYELMASVAPGAVARARSALAALHCPLTVVGCVSAGRGAWLRTARGLRPLPRAGWQPFREATVGR